MDTYVNRNIRIAGFILIIMLAATGFVGIAAADTSANHAKTQVLLYIVGSDLESGSGTATQDMQQIADSYANVDINNLDIIVAFGGANKDGWRGMKIATIEQLKNDAKDGKFGNGQYLYSDTGADMGTSQSLAKFLSVARASRTADRTVLILSDHGASYDGIGVDEVTSNSLHMNDIDTALRGAGITYNPILFDACLMSSVEVGKTVQPYTHLMLGSEEIQLGSYDYEKVMGLLVNDPDADSETLAKTIIGAYITDDQKSPQALTMSVIDTTRIPAVRDSLDALGAKLLPLCDDPQGLHDLKSAYNDAIRLGVSKGSAPTSVDLVSLLQNIEKRRPELSPDVQKTIGLIRQAVVYERHNSYSKAVSGISIASPDAMDPAKYQQYGDGVKISPHWDEFFVKMVAVSSGGNPAPGVSVSGSNAETTTSGAEAADARSLPRAKIALSKPGFVDKGNGSFALRDPYHSASVYESYFLINGSTVLSIGSQPASQYPDGLYRVPQWDGRWYYFPDQKASLGSVWDRFVYFLSDPTRKPQPLLLDMEYDDVTEGGSDIYQSWVSIRDNQNMDNANLILYANTTKSRYDISIVPYSVTETGDTLFGDGVQKFKTGSRVTSYTYGFDRNTKNWTEYVLGQTTAGPDMTPDYALLPDGTYAAGIMAYYDNDDEVFADQFRIVTIRDGAVVSSGIGRIW
jgi:hypothetical protein